MAVQGQQQAFFNFGNNAEENAQQIISQYERIQRALRAPLSLNPATISSDAGQMDAALGKVLASVEQRTARIKQLFNALGEGQITLPELRLGIQEQVQTAVRSIPTTLANEFGKLGPGALGRQNIQGLAGGLANDVVTYLNEATRQARKTAGVSGNSVPVRNATFAADIAAVTANPINVAGAGEVQAAQLRLMAEKIARAQYNNTLYKGQSPNDVAERLGLTAQVQRVLSQQAAPVDGKRQPFQALGAQDDLREAKARQAQAVRDATSAAKEEAEAGKAVAGMAKDVRSAQQRSLDAAMAFGKAMNKAAEEADKLASQTAAAARAQSIDANRAARNVALRRNPLVEQVTAGQYDRQFNRYFDPKGNRLVPGRDDERIQQIEAQREATETRARVDRKKAAAQEQAAADAATLKASRDEAKAKEDAAKTAAEDARFRTLGALRSTPTTVQTRSGYQTSGGDFYDTKGNQLNAGRAADELKINSIIAERRAMEATELANMEKANTLAAQRAAEEQRGFLGGAYARATRGSQGVLANLGAQAASAIQFTAGYGLLFAAQGALRDTLSEFLDYQDSITDLQVAMGEGSAVTQAYVGDLSDLSRVAGSNVGAALDTAARGVRALSDVTDSDAQKRKVGEQTARVASQLALVSNKSLQDATGDTLAVSTAFGLKPEELDQVVDAVANAKRTVGGDAGQISQGLALVALSAQEAGFNLNEAAAVIGLVQARTDQSGQAIATRLTRIFQIIQGSTGKGLAAELKDKLDPLGVTGQSSVKDQIEAYATIYSDPDTGQGTKARIASALGGTANLRELLPLLKENSKLQYAYAEALSNAGQGLDEYQRKSANLVGTLKKIAGDVSNIQVGLSNSGIADLLGAGLKTVEPALHTLDVFLNTMNQIVAKVPGLRQLVGVMVDLAIASKAVAVFQGLRAGGALAEAGVVAKGGQAAAEGAETATTRAAAATDAQGAEAALAYAAARRAASNADLTAAEREVAAAEASTLAANARTAALIRETEATGVSTVANNTKAAGSFRGGLGAIGASLTNPYVLGAAAIVGTLAIIGSALEEEKKKREIRSAYDDATVAYDDAGTTSDSIRQAAADLSAVAQRIEKVDSSDPNRTILTNSLNDRASGLRFVADQVAQTERLAVSNRNLTQATGGAVESVDQLASGLDAIGRDGGTAITQYNALIKALNTPLNDNAVQFTPRVLAGQVYESIAQAVSDPKNVPKSAIVNIDQGPAVISGDYIQPGTGNRRSTDPREVISQVPLGSASNSPLDWAMNGATDAPIDQSPARRITRAVLNQLKQRGITNRDGLSPGDIDAFVNTAVDTIDAPQFIQGFDEFKANVKKAVLKSLKDVPLYNQSTPLGALNGDSLSPTDIKSIIDPKKGEDGQPDYLGLQGYFEAAQQAIPRSDDGTLAKGLLGQQRATLQQLVNKGERYATNHPDEAGDVRKQLQFINALLANAQHDYAESAIQELDELRLAAESRADSQPELQRIRIRFSRQQFRQAGGDRKLLGGLMANVDKKTLDAVLAYMRTARDTTALALQHQRALVGASAQALGALDAAGFTVDPGALTDKLKKKLDKQNANIKAFLDVLNGTVVNGDKAEFTDDSGTEAGSVAVAQAAARAARLGGGIASAQAALVAARDALNKATPGTVDYFNALASLYTAKQQMSDAVLAYKGTLDQLSGDFTDPVEQARDALTGALRKLAADAGKGKDVRAEDKLAVEQARTSLEAAAFSQRLSDVQTAEQLGRISHQSYIRYLENESKRLHSINGKTRQQIDEMNQIDLALKEAASELNAQFNLGDIRTDGLVYQVRRFAAEAQQNGGAQFTGGNGTKGFNSNNPPVYNQNSGNTVTINGADVSTVRRLLRELLGPNTQTRAPQSRKYV